MPPLTRIATPNAGAAGVRGVPARRARAAPPPPAAAAEAAPAADTPAPDLASDPKSGLRHLGPAGVVRATHPKANPIEKKKNAKSGAEMWTEG